MSLSFLNSLRGHIIYAEVKDVKWLKASAWLARFLVEKPSTQDTLLFIKGGFSVI